MKNKKLASKYIYRGRIIDLRLDEIELPDGRAAEREIIEHPGAAAIVPLDSQGKLHLVRQYRDAVEETLLEIPAGKLKSGEDPESCARRELREELGLAAGRMTHLFTFYSTPGFCDEVMHVYLAEDLSKDESGIKIGEFIEPEVYSIDSLEEIISRLKDGKSLAGILLAKNELERRD